MTRGLLVALIVLVFAAGMMILVSSAIGQGNGKAPSEAASSAASRNPTDVAASQQTAEALRIEGEKRFRANCGRCHQAPHKFPPRMMATIVRHMRVRATITDEDMRLILLYMTQ